MAHYGFESLCPLSAAQRDKKMRLDQFMATCGGFRTREDYPAKGEPDAPVECEGCGKQGESADINIAALANLKLWVGSGLGIVCKAEWCATPQCVGPEISATFSMSAQGCTLAFLHEPRTLPPFPSLCLLWLLHVPGAALRCIWCGEWYCSMHCYIKDMRVSLGFL
jgi:hypothetical protein